MSRLNKERQKSLEPVRIDLAKQKIEAKGYNVVQMGKTELRFMYKQQIIRYFPYSGWASGGSIKDGRGLNHLLKQI